MMDLLLGLVLGAVALALLAYIIALVFGALSSPLATYLERRQFTRHVARSRECDQLLQQEKVDEALPLLLSSFYLAPLRNRGLGSAVANHHTGLLSRLIALTPDARGGSVRLLSLAKTDRLLTERAALQKRYFTVAQGGSAERRRDVRRKLETNRRELTTALGQLVEEVRAARRPEMYH